MCSLAKAGEAETNSLKYFSVVSDWKHTAEGFYRTTSSGEMWNTSTNKLHGRNSKEGAVSIIQGVAMNWTLTISPSVRTTNYYTLQRAL
jgi:hypothetical protein